MPTRYEAGLDEVTMDGVARCSSCLRRERRRDGDVVEVEMSGGARRPDVPSELAAWRTLRRVKAGELDPPVAVCSACGQPMFVVQGELPPLAGWTFQLPDGPIVVGPDGRAADMDDDEANRRIEEHHRPALETGNGPWAVAIASILFVVTLGFGGIISLCDCPSVALALVASGGATLTKRSRD